MTITPYLFFGGQCHEALDFYRDSVGADIGPVMAFSESPDPVPDGMLAPGFESKVMHSSFTIGGARIHASDGCSEADMVKGVSLALEVASEQDAHRVFNGLANGGRIEMPLGPTFWSPCYGMLTDKFGIGWMVMVIEQGCDETH